MPVYSANIVFHFHPGLRVNCVSYAILGGCCSLILAGGRSRTEVDFVWKSKNKSRIRETVDLSTCADSSTNGKKSEQKK